MDEAAPQAVTDLEYATQFDAYRYGQPPDGRALRYACIAVTAIVLVPSLVAAVALSIMVAIAR